MVNLKDKLSSLKSIVSKDDASSSPSQSANNDPFGSDTDPFASGPPGFDSVPDLTNGGGGAPDFEGLPDFNQFPPSAPGANGFGAESSGTPGQQANSSNPKQVEENKDRINSLEKKLSKFEMSFNMMERENKEIKETVTKIDQSVIELLSLYEIVSNQVNPFVGENESGRDTIERFDKAEKRINEVGDMTVSLKNDVASLQNQLENMGMTQDTEDKISEIEEKLDAFSQALEMLNENFENISSQLDSFNERTEQNEIIISDLQDANSVIIERLDKLEISNNGSIQDQPLNEPENDEKSKDANVTPLVKLETIKSDPTRVIVLLNWIEFLIEKVGRNNLMDALDYYIDIGWINEDVRLEILAYARGIDYNVEKTTWRLLPEDHTKSLLFIERLSGRKIDKNMLSTLDREMTKVKHGLEEMYGI
ncbi:flagella protein [Methanosalsum zhilinae DSM 4017]|uniref:Flagella protein n=1 Tax=Methanosalsum zhilinae (strain DSM 4017 / NBRC 107636 / OCM 62 / WeN5) TaxID=679901 RepID=F7XQ58_METZD|nr:FlaD/FlaE family flagellar protein [Methanosalsum zhilinae]AEH60420.1 flagella protein [Methanosalsum zhilinae DSM 4017]